MTLDEKIARFEKVESMLKHIGREFICRADKDMRLGQQIIEESIRRAGRTLDGLYAERIRGS